MLFRHIGGTPVWIVFTFWPEVYSAYWTANGDPLGLLCQQQPLPNFPGLDQAFVMVLLSAWRETITRGISGEDLHSYGFTTLLYPSILLALASAAYLVLWKGTSPRFKGPLPPGPAPGWKHTAP